MALKCNTCGAPLPDNASVCLYCGNAYTPKPSRSLYQTTMSQAEQDFNELDLAIEQYLEEETTAPLENALALTENRLKSYGIGSSTYYDYLRAFAKLYFEEDEITEFIGHCDSINNKEAELLFDEMLNSIVALVEPDRLEILRFKYQS